VLLAPAGAGGRVGLAVVGAGGLTVTPQRPAEMKSPRWGALGLSG